ncbi:MAG: alpha/beta fold hydrolase, partial [Phenylobacterium sp.]|nr:alpha/beta fold hydrolase [Phenylobacterium sp.]
MTERVLVIGAGIGGLCTALALASPERELILLERDPSPPAGDADEAFADWARRGVGHLRHSHAFLARLRLILRDEHPRLLADLQAIRHHLGIERWLVVGGSWGATLALAHALAESQAVSALLLRATFLARAEDITRFFQGAVADL